VVFHRSVASGLVLESAVVESIMSLLERHSGGSTMAAYQLGELTWPEAAGVLQQRPIGLLPVGAVEAHGPHLPLDTDIRIAIEMAKRAASLLHRAGLPVLVLPPVVYGVSFVGSSFPGTSPVDPEAFEAYLGSVLKHLCHQGYRALGICNAHLEPAHVAAVEAAARAAQSATGVPVAFPDKRQARWAAQLSEEFQRGARHAGRYETSLLLATSPEVVRLAELEDLPPVWIDLPARLRAGAKTFVEAGSPLGYFGDPGRASAEEGEHLFERLARMVCEAVLEALASRPPANAKSN
jgi:creatinine amidohydrolase